MTRTRQLALRLVTDVHDNPADATRLIGGVDRCDLEELVRDLARMVPVDTPLSQLGRGNPFGPPRPPRCRRCARPLAGCGGHQGGAR